VFEQAGGRGGNPAAAGNHHDHRKNRNRGTRTIANARPLESQYHHGTDTTRMQIEEPLNLCNLHSALKPQARNGRTTERTGTARGSCAEHDNPPSRARAPPTHLLRTSHLATCISVYPSDGGRRFYSYRPVARPIYRACHFSPNRPGGPGRAVGIGSRVVCMELGTNIKFSPSPTHGTAMHRYGRPAY
jgi:hypothetical protein